MQNENRTGKRNERRMRIEQGKGNEGRMRIEEEKETKEE